jgi:hypothetical protein
MSAVKLPPEAKQINLPPECGQPINVCDPILRQNVSNIIYLFICSDVFWWTEYLTRHRSVGVTQSFSRGRHIMKLNPKELDAWLINNAADSFAK